MRNRRSGFLRKYGLLFTILVLALLVRVVYLTQYSQSPAWEQLAVDNWYHHNWAISLADGNVLGDTTYFRAPLYVYTLGLLYALFGCSLWVARLYGLVIGLASVGLTYLLAGKLLTGRKAALLATTLHALYPVAVYFESEILLDPLFTLLLQIAVYRFLVWLESGRDRDIFIFGASLGLGAITRPTALVIILPAVVWISLRKKSQRPEGKHIAGRLVLLLLGLLVCIGPVYVRNLVVAGDPVLVSSQGGINLYIGNNDAADGVTAAMPEPLGHNWQIRQVRYLAESETGGKLTGGEVSDFWRNRAVDWVLSHPARALELLARKLGFQFADLEVSNNRSLGSHFQTIPILKHNPLSFGVIFALAGLGGLTGWRQRRSVRFVLALMIIYIATVSLFFYSSRFRLPLLPYYFILAAGGLVWIVESIRAKWRHMAWSLVVIAGLTLFAHYPPVSLPEGWSVQALTSQGLFLYNRNEISAAQRDFEVAALLDPDFPEVNLNLGVCYLRTGDAGAAEASFHREIGLHPGRPKAYYNLASVYLLNGRVGAATSWAQKALVIAPYEVTANLIHLRALGADTTVTTGDLMSAIETAAASTEDDLWVLNESAGLLVERGTIDSALDILRRAEVAVPPPVETDDLAFGPNFKHARSNFEREKATTYHLVGFCLAQSGDIAGAIRYSRRAIESDSSIVPAYVNLYTGYRSLGRLVEADSVLSEMAARFPRSELLKQLLVK